MLRWTAFFVALMAGLPAFGQSQPRVTSLRVGGTAAEMRLVLDTSALIHFSAATNESSIVLTLPRVNLDPAVETGKSQLLKSVTHHNAGDATMIVIVLIEPAKIKQSFSIPPRDGKGPRLVVDLVPADGSKTVANTKDNVPFIKTVPDKKTENIVSPFKMAANTTLIEVQKKASTKNQKIPASTGKQRVIVIDAGHGGVDPGAIGTGGVHEKDITLASAKALQGQLQKNPTYKVFLTRSTDIFIPLKGRRDIGRQHHADLFISLHADIMGSGDSSVRGASIYTISDEASDAVSAKLAAHENLSDAIAGIDVGKQEDEEVAGILIDLAMRETMNQSKRFASGLASSMAQDKVRLLEKPMRSAGFAVLKAPDVPSVLIEMGFLSSPAETASLQSDVYRQRLTASIAKGVDDYFRYMDRQGN